MQILVMHGPTGRTRALQVSMWQIVSAGSGLLLALLLLSGAIYHYFFLKAAQEGWPVVSQLVKLVVRDEIAQRDRFMRENLDAIAQRVGDMQARMIKLEAMGDRVSGLAGLKPDDLKAIAPRPASAAGGPFVPLTQPSLEQLRGALHELQDTADTQTDLMTLLESRLLEYRLRKVMIPSSPPVAGPIGSGFGFRSDPFTGRPALHTGLDFPSPIGTPIHAAAAGVVKTAQWHPEYGNELEIDHGNGLVTRYGHTSKILVKVGDLVRRGQVVALVGSTGRSTGPHLHFEVLVDGVQQDPSKFLALGAVPHNLAAASPAAAASGVPTPFVRLTGGPPSSPTVRAAIATGVVTPRPLPPRPAVGVPRPAAAPVAHPATVPAPVPVHAAATPAPVAAIAARR